MKTFFYFLVFYLLCTLTLSASAMIITSDAPGNVFIAGSPIRLEIKDAQGEISYGVTDYFGANKASGKITSVIELPGLQPGWYEVKCKDNAGEATTSIGVVMNRGKAPLPENGRICTDVAAAWLVNASNYQAITRMIRIAGIPWVRERLHWIGKEKERNIADWEQYQAVADDYAVEGIHVYQICHDSPRWSHPGRDGNVCPDDLRDYYYFIRDAANHFSKQISAWEIWNEPDIGFWPDQSDRYSGLVKAGYLGIKDGNPKAMVLQGSILGVGTQFEKSIYESGTIGYFDVYNCHIYKKPIIYPSVLADHLDLLSKYSVDDRPVWVTEAGVSVEGSEGPDKKILNTENQHIQCQYIPRAAAMSLAAGTDKYFFFVLPHYTEGPVQWGALRPDLTPYPSFIALSTAANILGQSTYKGEYKPGNNAITAQFFSTGKGNVMVAWSDTETEMTVPTDKRYIRIANVFGEENSIKSENGVVKVKLGPDAIYLFDLGRSVEKNLTGKPRPHGKLPKLNPSRVVVVGHTELSVNKDFDAYILKNQDAFNYIVDVYNFNEKTGASGTVEVTAPDGWTVSNSKQPVIVGTMGRETLRFRVKPGALSVNRFKITVNADFKGDKVAPCVSAFKYDLDAVTPTQRKPLDWAKRAGQWLPEASHNCALMINNIEPDAIHFDTKFDSKEDRWAYPVLRFEKPLDFSGFDGIAFDLNVPEESYASVIRLMLVEPDGATYTASTKSIGAKHRVVLLFKDMELFQAGKPDPNGQFDLNAISAVKFGCNAGRDYLLFDVSNFELVKF